MKTIVFDHRPFEANSYILIYENGAVTNNIPVSSSIKTIAQQLFSSAIFFHIDEIGIKSEIPIISQVEQAIRELESINHTPTSITIKEIK